MLRAVLFDLDGVITDTAEYHYLAWKELADEMEIPFDRKYNEKLKGVSRMESLELILKRSEHSEKYTEEEKNELAQKKNLSYRKWIDKITPEDILPGIEQFIFELKDAGIKVALASSSKNAVTIIEKLGMMNQFDFIADAGQAKNAKPYPDLFLMCAQGLDLPTQECIGIEDARAGITAIHRAGMKAVGVGTDYEMEEADLKVEDTSKLKLKDILEKLF